MSVSPARDRLKEAQATFAHADEFLPYKELLTTYGDNAHSLLIIFALAQQAQNGLSSESLAAGNILSRLHTLTKIPRDQQINIVGLLPRVATQSGYQVIFLKPIVGGNEPETILPPLFSWGGLVRGLPGITLARPALETSGGFVYTGVNTGGMDLSKIIKSHLEPLLFADEHNLSDNQYLAKAPGESTVQMCNIAIRAIKQQV